MLLAFDHNIVDLGEFRRQRERDAVHCDIERGESPDNPAVSYYKIRGATFAAVQSQINGLIAEVESLGAGGYGTFLGPKRGDDGNFYALGRVEVAPDV
jgi:hypothetical protein